MPIHTAAQTGSASRTTDAIAPVEARVRSGELWRLGEHLLLCGDCTDAAAVARLMRSQDHDGDNDDIEEADLMFLDPPYGVGYGSPARKAYHPVRSVAGDDLGEYGTYDLLRRALLAAPLKPGGVFYVCSAGGPNETIFRLALRDAGFPLKQSLVWVKHHFVLGRQDYQWKHETLLYGWKAGSSHYFGGGRTQTTVWEHPRPIKSRHHPTMKPVPLVARAVILSSREGELVYDGFGGSGTTLLACEQTGRRCKMMEIEPHYCDVILARWEERTGKRAERLLAGNPT